jgi:hypothetical protein
MAFQNDVSNINKVMILQKWCFKYKKMNPVLQNDVSNANKYNAIISLINISNHYYIIYYVLVVSVNY